MNEEDDHEELKNKIDKLVITLPKDESFGVVNYKYQGIWFPFTAIRGAIAFQKLFKAQDSDIILASLPKSGTTWLKALIFSVVNRSRYTTKNTPLLTTHPHDLVCSAEINHYRDGLPQHHLLHISQPRIFAVHTHHASLPHSVLDSNCKIVYVCRNPMDNFVSAWHFACSIKGKIGESPPLVDESFRKYCEGAASFGPFWENVLGYWKASIENPKKVLFMMYEDMKEDIVSELKRLATFLGFPFTEEEEAQGLVEEISSLCSFENLKNLKVNQNDSGSNPRVPPNAFFRNGKVGDYTHLLTPSMAEYLKKLADDKFAGSGLVFKYAN
ncbi:hypothetical protein FNV43_RR09485 [Rhamnella rubrinervis]|uniref:Sulfotransferase n=1 Tax=Rhamnella rubrinervis TaxID=2594499 RepID=A0A8K0HA25_9ROSA|nr:hypothetical protein FNV43_RR09485 [Rhamnella rubrinervis]